MNSFIISLLIVVSGCGFCKVATNAKDPRCQAQVIASKCAEPKLAKLVVQLIPKIVSALISSDYAAIISQLLSDLEQEGVQDALGVITCAIETVDGNTQVGAAEDSNLAAIKAHARLWLIANKQ